MSGPPASYYLDGTPPVNAPPAAYSGAGFAAAQVEAPAVWVDPTAPTNTNPIIAMAMGTGMMSGQFSGPALWSMIVGVACLALPFFTPLYFRFLPFAGIITGIRAILSGRLIGGLIGIGLNVVAGALSLIYMGVIHF
jgi:hypothetical protein